MIDTHLYIIAGIPSSPGRGGGRKAARSRGRGDTLSSNPSITSTIIQGKYNCTNLGRNAKKRHNPTHQQATHIKRKHQHDKTHTHARTRKHCGNTHAQKQIQHKQCSLIYSYHSSDRY